MSSGDRPKPRLAPLPLDHQPALRAHFESLQRRMGFVPNSQLVMQRRPNIVLGLAKLGAAVLDPEGSVDSGFKRLISHVCSRAAGCSYCTAHEAHGALRAGVDGARLKAVWEYRSSPLFSEAERAALDLAIAAGTVPNAVTDEQFDRLRQHWNEEQIVEIVAVIALFGFLNRWNDTLATPIESEPLAVGATWLAADGWEPGKHRG